MGCALHKAHYVGQAETAFNIRLNNYRKVVNNPKLIPANLNFRKLGQSFNLHARFTLIEQLSNIHKTNKDAIKLLIKRREDFWIKKPESLSHEG